MFFLQNVQKQFQLESYNTTIIGSFNFEVNGNLDPSIEIHFERLQPGRWILGLERARKASYGEIPHVCNNNNYYTIATITGMHLINLVIQYGFSCLLYTHSTFLLLHLDFQIRAHEIDFWNVDQAQMKTKERYNLYPPRFTIEVNGERAESDTCAEIRFSGVKEPQQLQVEIILLRTRRASSKC